LGGKPSQRHAFHGKARSNGHHLTHAATDR
jgi:hypothetical protein